MLSVMDAGHGAGVSRCSCRQPSIGRTNRCFATARMSAAATTFAVPVGASTAYMSMVPNSCLPLPSVGRAYKLLATSCLSITE